MVTLSERMLPVLVVRAAVQMVRISQGPAVNSGGQVGRSVGRLDGRPVSPNGGRK